MPPSHSVHVRESSLTPIAGPQDPLLQVQLLLALEPTAELELLPQERHLSSASFPENVTEYLPTPQFSQAVAALPENFPGPQLGHDDAALPENLPASQSVQSLFAVDPVVALYVPIGQSSQGAVPTVSLYLPGPHAEQGPT